MESVRSVPVTRDSLAGALPALRRGPATTAAELIERYLGPGRSTPGETFWRITKFGRPCLVYLHTWANRSQTVTTLDVARPSDQMVLHIEIDPPARPGIAELATELRALTTRRISSEEAPAGRG
jgi:hypothetical protein